MSSHDLSEVEQVCDWLVLIDTGRSLYQGPTGALLDSVAPRLDVVPQRSKDVETLHRLLVASGHQVEMNGERLTVSVDGTDPRTVAASVNETAFAAGMVLVELTRQHSTLEDR